jgi:hypothetical protein
MTYLLADLHVSKVSRNPCDIITRVLGKNFVVIHTSSMVSIPHTAQVYGSYWAFLQTLTNGLYLLMAR